MRLISSDSACSSSSMKPAGSAAYTGQRIRPPAFCDISPLVQARSNSGQAQVDHDEAQRDHEDDDADDVDEALVRGDSWIWR
jgi:hypothetical protein